MIRDDFAGPGGWDEGLRLIGRIDVVGFEWDAAACETAVAAGHKRICADVSTYPSDPFRDKLAAYIASPSCTLFSNAGKGTGRDAMVVLVAATQRMFAGDDCREEVRGIIFDEFTHPARIADNEWRKWKAERDSTQARKIWSEERVAEQARTDAFIASLVLEPARVIYDLRPPVVALEQVPTVLPIWEAYVHELKRMGYSAWTGVLCAADYGVPQTRRRAIVMASLLGPVHPPVPTHSEHGETDDLFGASRKKWTSMAAALGWGLDGSVAPARGAGMTERHGERNPHPAHGPAPTVISKSRSWVVDRGTNSKALGGTMVPTVGVGIDRPAPTILFGHALNAVMWYYERPATTIVGSFSPDIVSPPGYRTEVSRQNAEGGVKVTVAEGGVLQSFPADYPWQGSRTKKYEQVGNAVPPRLAAHICAALGLGDLPEEWAA